MNTEEKSIDEKPPVFQTWNQVYVFVLILHVALITSFYLLTSSYS